MEVQKAPLHTPTLEEVAAVLQQGLLENFEDVSVSVVDCPDLTQEPFRLAAKGLGGSSRVADVGGVPYLIPTVKKEKVYNLETVAQQCELPGSLVVGAGAGPAHVVGVNSEMTANVKSRSNTCETINNTHLTKVNPQDGSYSLLQSPTTDFCLLGNFYISEGNPGKVLEIKAKRRKGPLNYATCLRQTLKKHYGTKPVGLGGTFLVETGKAWIHVMPDFADHPLDCDDKMNQWLKFYEMSAPLVCMGYLISSDPDLDLRMEHFHCFSAHGDGGHYHYDTTPNDVSYRGYFNVAEYMFRIDRPKDTHTIGRD